MFRYRAGTPGGTSSYWRRAIQNTMVRARTWYLLLNDVLNTTSWLVPAGVTHEGRQGCRTPGFFGTMRSFLNFPHFFSDSFFWVPHVSINIA
jgi:hypothetical protein